MKYIQASVKHTLVAHLHWLEWRFPEAHPLQLTVYPLADSQSWAVWPAEAEGLLQKGGGGGVLTDSCSNTLYIMALGRKCVCVRGKQKNASDKGTACYQEIVSSPNNYHTTKSLPFVLMVRLAEKDSFCLASSRGWVTRQW